MKAVLVTPISAYGGYVAWSRKRPGTDRWELWYWLYGPHTEDPPGDCPRRGCRLLRSAHLKLGPVPDPDPVVAGGG